MQLESAIAVWPVEGAIPGAMRGEGAAGREISVIFTSVGPTTAALKYAGELARLTGAKVTIVAPQIVPFPAPLASTPLLREWNEARFRTIAEESSVETSVRVYLCRDRVQTLLEFLRPGSLMVIGGRRRRWWPTADERLARRLRRAGRPVVFVGEEDSTLQPCRRKQLYTVRLRLLHP